MAFEPINIFSRRCDPRGVIELLRRSGYAVEVTGPDDDWTKAIVTFRRGGWFRQPLVMELGHSRDYYESPNWQHQLLGMQSYFANFPETPRKADVIRTLGTFQFALSAINDDLDIDSSDERLQLLYAVCRHLDGVIFTPSSLRDVAGRILLDTLETVDSAAVLPQMPPTGDHPRAADEDPAIEDDLDEECEPPSALRVAKRALVLAALGERGLIESEADKADGSAEEERKEVLAWINSLELDDELEPDEWKVLQRPIGTLESQARINAVWRLEGCTVLAWALGWLELPVDDQLIVPMDLFKAVSFFAAEQTAELLVTPQLRPAEELAEMQKHLLMFHWRMRNYRLHPDKMDFVTFSQNCWVGSFDISRFRILDNDLAIGEHAIAEADPDAVQIASSIAAERHQAINWLMGQCNIYSETDTST